MSVEGLNRRLVAFSSFVVKKGLVKTGGYHVQLVLLGTTKGTAKLLMLLPRPKAKDGSKPKYKYKFLTELSLDGARLMATDHPTTFQLVANQVNASKMTTTLLDTESGEEYSSWMEKLRRAIAHRLNRQMSDRSVGL